MADNHALLLDELEKYKDRQDDFARGKVSLANEQLAQNADRRNENAARLNEIKSGVLSINAELRDANLEPLHSVADEAADMYKKWQEDMKRNAEDFQRQKEELNPEETAARDRLLREELDAANQMYNREEYEQKRAEADENYTNGVVNGRAALDEKREIHKNKQKEDREAIVSRQQQELAQLEQKELEDNQAQAATDAQERAQLDAASQENKVEKARIDASEEGKKEAMNAAIAAIREQQQLSQKKAADKQNDIAANRKKQEYDTNIGKILRLVTYLSNGVAGRDGSLAIRHEDLKDDHVILKDKVNEIAQDANAVDQETAERLTQSAAHFKTRAELRAARQVQLERERQLRGNRRLATTDTPLRPSERALERYRLMDRPKSHIVVLEQLLEEINSRKN